MGRFSMPTIVFPDGRIIRDGVAIVDFFEERSGHSAKPPSPCQHIVSLLFDVLGAEGLCRPAMHYRFNFDEEQYDFILYHFTSQMNGDEEHAKKVIAHVSTNVAPGVRPSTHATRNSTGVLSKNLTRTSRNIRTYWGENLVLVTLASCALYGH